MIKKAKTIRKDNVLCCKGNDLIIVIGDLKRTYKQKKNKPYKRYGRKIYFIKRRPRYFLKKIGIQDKERFIEKILERQKNAGVRLAIKLDIMQMNVLIN